MSFHFLSPRANARTKSKRTAAITPQRFDNGHNFVSRSFNLLLPRGGGALMSRRLFLFVVFFLSVLAPALLYIHTVTHIRTWELPKTATVSLLLLTAEQLQKSVS